MNRLSWFGLAAFIIAGCSGGESRAIMYTHLLEEHLQYARSLIGAETRLLSVCLYGSNIQSAAR